MKINFASNLKYIIPVLVIILVNVFYFLPQFQGKVVSQGDIIQYVGMSKEAVDFRDKTGDQALWTNSMFGGMPAYQISVENKNNLLKYIEKALSGFLAQPAGFFVSGMIGFYLLMLLLGVNPWLSLLGALMFGFTTNNFTLFEAGHNSKLMAIMTSAPVIAGVLLVFREKWVLGGVVFGVALGLNVMCNHPQMTFYLALCLGLLVIFELVKSIKEQKLASFGKAIGILSIFAVLALGASASKLWTTYEYAKDTMRGAPILTSENTTPTSSSETNGLEWEYAMQWSNGTGDVLATFIPKAVGGASGEWVDGNSPIGKAVGQRKEFQAPTYWGSLPFTSGPAYFGIVAFFLFVFGLFVVKGEVKWWILSAVVFTILLSMGKHFEGLNRLLFDYFPMFNKFRAPSSVLSITALFIPILGVLGLSEILKSSSRESYLKPLYYATGIVGGLCLMLWAFGGSFFDFSSPGDQQYEQIKDVLLEQRASMLSSSALRSLVFVIVIVGVLWLFIKDKVNVAIMIAVISISGLFDLVQIGRDYLDKKDFVTKSNYKNNFEPRPADTQILQDKDPNFRVYDASVNTFNSASTSYFHKTIGGYHAAKLQRYQDIIDRHITKSNQSVLNMLNTKYFIFEGPDKTPTVQRNPAALGNAWFVNNIISVPNPNAEIDSLTNFDPAGDVVINDEYKDYVKGLSLAKNGSIELKVYGNNKLEYESNSTTEQFAVFSEIWYGPNKGWVASIDGKEMEFIRVNYLLRGMKIPAGQHKIVFEFKPQSFYYGEMISLISSLLLLIGLGYIIYIAFKKEESLVATN